MLFRNYENQTDKIKEVPMPKGHQSLINTCHSKLSKRPTSILWTNGISLMRFKIPDAD